MSHKFDLKNMEKLIRHKLTIVFVFLITQLSFGQDKTPVVQPFLSDIISQFPNVRDLTISLQEDEIYFTIQSYLGEISTIVTCKRKDGKWSDPEVASFSGMHKDLEPFLSPDQLRLYFVSNRPTDSISKKPKDYDIWFVERRDVSQAWSLPKNIGSPINTPEDEFYPSVSAFNNLFFTRDGAGSKGKDDIFKSKWENGKYTSPVSLNDSINTSGYEFNAFIAPDESFLLYTCYNRDDGMGSGDLYISYKKQNDEWSVAENMGKEINSGQMDYCPFVNVKSGILYFTSKRSDVKSRFDKRQNASELLKEMNKYPNGQSRIYQVNIKEIMNRIVN